MNRIKLQPTVDQRISMLHSLQESLLNDAAHWEPFIEKAYTQNQWFTPENCRQALAAIARCLLDTKSLKSWIATYHLPEKPKKVGLIMAGNIPLVGFADWLAVFICGHTALVKLSSKDEVLFPTILQFLESAFPDYDFRTEIMERLSGYDALIATGSNNSAQYFEQYFNNVPHIIRRNRTSVAVLHGDESEMELKALWHDIADYFGLGCRNVSFLLVPQDYRLEHLPEIWEVMDGNQNHHKYRNNYDYNLAINLLNKFNFLQSEQILLIESAQLYSRIASVHFQRYSDINAAMQFIESHTDEIQCVISTKEIAGIQCVAPGNAQCPGLSDYADGVDTMAFLTTLDNEKD